MHTAPGRCPHLLCSQPPQAAASHLQQRPHFLRLQVGRAAVQQLLHRHVPAAPQRVLQCTQTGVAGSTHTYSWGPRI